MLSYCFFATPTVEYPPIPMGATLRSTRLGRKYLTSAKGAAVKIETLDQGLVAREFSDFFNLASKKGVYVGFGIEFELTFASADDVHGIEFSREFIEAAAEWGASLSVAIAVSGRQDHPAQGQLGL